MPIELIYLLALLVTIVFWFVILKRPIYEAMIVGYIVLIVITRRFDLFIPIILDTATYNLFYAVFAFLMLSYIFSLTGVIHDINDIIISLLGKFSGGAGYVALISSTFMASLSGTGPGNVAATGVFTIPSMIRTGYPRALAASVEMAASALGPMIPPSGTILVTFGAFEALYPGEYSISNFWMAVWMVGIYFIIQRVITLFILIRVNNIKPIPESEIPDLKTSLKKGWKALLTPVIIFLPLFLDNMYNETIVAARIGEAGAKAFSSSVILFTPGIAAIYAFLISKEDIRGVRNISGIIELFKDAMETVMPVSAAMFFSYAISNLFGVLDVGANIGVMIEGLGLSRIGMIIMITVLCAVLGMIIQGSSIVAIFGVAIISSLAAVGVEPIVAAATLPAITGSLAGMTPPLAMAMYAAMGIARSSFKETAKYAYIWVIIHMIVAALIFMGILPLIGI